MGSVARDKVVAFVASTVQDFYARPIGSAVQKLQAQNHYSSHGHVEDVNMANQIKQFQVISLYHGTNVYIIADQLPSYRSGVIGYRQKFFGLTLKGRISTNLAPLTLSVGGYFNHL